MRVSAAHIFDKSDLCLLYTSSSLPGVAVTSIKIDGVQHEFSTVPGVKRSEEHTSELQSLSRISYAVFSVFAMEHRKYTVNMLSLIHI